MGITTIPSTTSLGSVRCTSRPLSTPNRQDSGRQEPWVRIGGRTPEGSRSRLIVSSPSGLGPQLWMRRSIRNRNNRSGPILTATTPPARWPPSSWSNCSGIARRRITASISSTPDQLCRLQEADPEPPGGAVGSWVTGNAACMDFVRFLSNPSKIMHSQWLVLGWTIQRAVTHTATHVATHPVTPPPPTAGGFTPHTFLFSAQS